MLLFGSQGMLYIRALRSRSLRDGSLTNKDRFAVFVHSFDSFNIKLKNIKVLLRHIVSKSKLMRPF